MTDEEKVQARESAAKLLATDRLPKIAAGADSFKDATTVYEDGTETHGRR
jgi:hypothetical protein